MGCPLPCVVLEAVSGAALKGWGVCVNIPVVGTRLAPRHFGGTYALGPVAVAALPHHR